MKTMKADIKIEEGIPMPGAGKDPGAFSDIMRQMKPGQSALFPDATNAVRVMAHEVFGRGKYKTRRENGGTRVWCATDRRAKRRKK